MKLLPKVKKKMNWDSLHPRLNSNHEAWSSFSLYTQVMLILILIDVQYLQNVVFTLEKVQMVKFTLPQIPTTQ